MQLLEEAGIYILTVRLALRPPVPSRQAYQFDKTLSSPSFIDRKTPYASYNPTVVKSLLRTIDVIASYSNTLALLVADRLIMHDADLIANPVIKAIVRDVKRYMILKNESTAQRMIPIVYSANTASQRDMTVLEYLFSGDASRSIDLWTVSNLDARRLV